MKIGLIDADLMWRKVTNGRGYGKTKADIFPNLVMMKLSAYHKKQGNEVGWYNPIEGSYDIVYISKVFSTTPMDQHYIDAKLIVCGGTGFQIKLVNGKEVFEEDVYFDTSKQSVVFSKRLPDEIEHIMPDYSLYPGIKDTAYGFLTRGCPRGCGFCHVAPKEGRKSYKVADLSEWWGGQKEIVLCDPNLLACKDAIPLMKQLVASGAKIDINQGIDARLMTPEKAELLNQMKLKTIHFAWDDYKQKDAVLKGLRIFKEHFSKNLDKGHLAQVFVLVNYDTTWEQDLERIYTLKEMHFEPYVMIYDKTHAAHKYKSLQRWVNMRMIFHKIDRFEDYDPIAAKE